MNATLKIFKQPHYLLIAGSGFMATLLILLWFFNLGTLSYVFSNTALTIFEKIGFIFSGVANVFRYFNNFLPISFVTISVFQGVGIAQYFWLRRHTGKSKLSGKSKASVGIGLLGTACIACSGSIIYPLVAGFGFGVAGAISLLVGQAAALGSVVLSFLAVYQLNKQVLIVQEGLL